MKVLRRLLPQKRAIQIEELPLENRARIEEQLQRIARGNPRMAEEIQDQLNKGDTKTRRVIQQELEDHMAIFDYYDKRDTVQLLELEV